MVAFTTALVATGGLSVGAQWEMSRKPRDGGISQLLISLGPARNAERVYYNRRFKTSLHKAISRKRLVARWLLSQSAATHLVVIRLLTRSIVRVCRDDPRLAGSGALKLVLDVYPNSPTILLPLTTCITE